MHKGQDHYTGPVPLYLLTALFFLSVLVVLWHRQIYGLETRSALFVRGMLEGGSLLVPCVYGKPYTDYPPLFFLAQYLFSLSHGHVSAISISLPSTLSASALILLTWWFTKRYLGHGVALVSAICLAGLPEFWLKAQRATLDMLLALECSLSVISFYEAEQSLSKARSRMFSFMGYCSILAALLTKGPVGLILPFSAWTVYLALQKRLTDILKAIPTWLMVCLLGLFIEALLFYKAGGLHMIKDAAWSQLFSRIGGKANKPFYYYFLYLALSFMPWLLWLGIDMILAKGAFPDISKQIPDAKNSFIKLLTGWSAGTLIPFVISSSRHGRYMLPAFVPLSIITAIAVSATLSRMKRKDLLRLQKAILILSAIVSTAILAFFLMDPLGSGRPLLALCLISTMALLCVWAGRGIETPQRQVFFLAILLIYATSSACLAIEPGISRRESAKSFVTCTEKKLLPQERVVLFKMKPDKYGLKYALFSHAYPGRLLFAKNSQDLSRLEMPFLIIVRQRDQASLRPFLSTHAFRPVCQGTIHAKRVFSFKIESSKK